MNQLVAKPSKPVESRKRRDNRKRQHFMSTHKLVPHHPSHWTLVRMAKALSFHTCMKWAREGQSSLFCSAVSGENKKFYNVGNWSDSVEKIRSGFLPSFDSGNERPHHESDFKDHFGRSLSSLKAGLQICESVAGLNIRQRPDILKNFFVPLLLLCSENNQVSMS